MKPRPGHKSNDLLHIEYVVHLDLHQHFLLLLVSRLMFTDQMALHLTTVIICRLSSCSALHICNMMDANFVCLSFYVVLANFQTACLRFIIFQWLKLYIQPITYLFSNLYYEDFWIMDIDVLSTFRFKYIIALVCPLCFRPTGGRFNINMFNQYRDSYYRYKYYLYNKNDHNWNKNVFIFRRGPEYILHYVLKCHM